MRSQAGSLPFWDRTLDHASASSQSTVGWGHSIFIPYLSVVKGVTQSPSNAHEGASVKACRPEMQQRKRRRDDEGLASSSSGKGKMRVMSDRLDTPVPASPLLRVSQRWFKACVCFLTCPDRQVKAPSVAPSWSMTSKKINVARAVVAVDAHPVWS